MARRPPLAAETSKDDAGIAAKYANERVAAIPLGLVLLDAELRVTSANEAFLHTFQLESADIAGRRLTELGRPELTAAALAERLDELRSGALQTDLDVEQPQPAGGARSFLLSARCVDSTARYLLALQDVTDNLAYQERLQRMSFEAVVTEEQERRRIAIDLHDRLGQALALAQIKLGEVRRELSGDIRSRLDAATEILEQAITDMGSVIFDLSPPVLYDLGLQAALGWLAEDLERRHGIKVQVSDDGKDKPLDDAAKGVVFRAVRELLMNVLKHAGCTDAKVTLHLAEDQLHVDVEDRGVGFDPGLPADSPGHGFGLLSVREQLAHLDGNLSVASSPGEGTVASVRIPVRTCAPPTEGGASAPAQDRS
jgi:signal transduction histidine kinase